MVLNHQKLVAVDSSNDSTGTYDGDVLTYDDDSSGLFQHPSDDVEFTNEHDVIFTGLIVASSSFMTLSMLTSCSLLILLLLSIL